MRQNKVNVICGRNLNPRIVNENKNYVDVGPKSTQPNGFNEDCNVFFLFHTFMQLKPICNHFNMA